MQQGRHNPEEEERDERGDQDCEIHKEDETEGEVDPEELDATAAFDFNMQNIPEM